MEQQFSQLLVVLRREIELYRSLTATLDDESQQLIANNTEGIIDVSRCKDTLALQIRSLEESRLLLIEKFAETLGCQSETLALADLCEHAPKTCRESLLQARSELKRLVDQATRHNERNRHLIENSLSLLHGLMERMQELLRSNIKPKNAYGPARPKTTARSGGMMVRQQV